MTTELQRRATELASSPEESMGRNLLGLAIGMVMGGAGMWVALVLGVLP